MNAVLAPLGYVIHGIKKRAAERFVVCTDSRGEVERYGLFQLWRMEDKGLRHGVR